MYGTTATVAGQIRDLFREVGGALYEAYIETDGADPEWPLWYAEYSREESAALLDKVKLDATWA